MATNPYAVLALLDCKPNSSHHLQPLKRKSKKRSPSSHKKSLTRTGLEDDICSTGSSSSARSIGESGSLQSEAVAAVKGALLASPLLANKKIEPSHSKQTKMKKFAALKSEQAGQSAPSFRNRSGSDISDDSSRMSGIQEFGEEQNEELEKTPLFVLVTTYFGYLLLILTGHIRDFFGKFFKSQKYAYLSESKGLAPLTTDFDSFYTRRLYTRIRDCWNRPITGVPGRMLTLLDRRSNDYNHSFELTGTQSEALNLSSYNFLGFAQNEGLCADHVEVRTAEVGIGIGSSRFEAGTTDLILKLEKLVARFVGKEDALVSSMGFATNSTTLPALVEKGCLIISDELNHSSLVFGARLSKATIRIFKHNSVKDLENVLRDSIAQGQPRTHRPWKKILVVVEGLYSMEGNICNLPGIVALKSKYKFYLYVDEAHSIGALGPNGGGVCDYFGVNPADVDILMGTFTKSFGGAGGYICANKDVIQHLKQRNHGSVYAETMSPAVVEQVYTSLRIILGEIGGEDGKKRLCQISENSRYFRKGLRNMGFILYGHDDSPVIPMLLCNPGKIAAFSRECLKRGIAVVVVGYPATPIITSRARFCISASHTREDLDYALKQISEVGDILMLKYRDPAF